MSGTYLDRIIEATLARVDRAKRKVPQSSLVRDPHDVPRGFQDAIAKPGLSLIAEVKRRSPSAGDIMVNVDAASMASKYEAGGASAVSVLTEPDFFGGSLADLQAARGAIDLPVLRKDFVVDTYQVHEAAAVGADAILLIVAAFEESAPIKDLMLLAEALTIDVLIEVHSREELDIAMLLEPKVIGVNQRNLKTFEVDNSLAARLRLEIPQGVAVVAESGVKGRADIEQIEAAEIDGVLIGETLMRSGEPEKAIRELLGRNELAD